MHLWIYLYRNNVQQQKEQIIDVYNMDENSKLYFYI